MKKNKKRYNRSIEAYMKKFYSRFQNFQFSEISIPLALLSACILGFGLLIPRLGFYMDDWPYVFYAYNKGIPSLKEMLFYDSRPGAAWLYMSAFRVLGFKPLHWHIAMLILRWLTVILMWGMLRKIWPTRTREITQFALLFSIYPFFMLQPSAVGSTHHWVGFVMYGLSVWLMIHAVQNRKHFVPATIGAVLLVIIHLITSEYFAGLELLRPIILWILLSRIKKDRINTAKSVITNWLPYLFGLSIFVYWRAFIFKYPPDITRNTPVIFNLLFHKPIQALRILLEDAIKDTAAVLTMGWQQAIDVKLIDFSTLFGEFRILIFIFSFILIYFFLSRLSFRHLTATPKDDWDRGSFVLALVGLFVGGLPVWLIGRSIIESKNLVSASRFGLPATFGAAFIVTLAINYLVSDWKRKNLVLALLFALAVNLHLDNTKGFQYSWEKQIRLYQELTWRAPSIKPDTAIVTDQEILGYMGQYATSFSIITIYQPGKITSPPYWYFPVYYTYPNLGQFVAGIPIDDQKLSMQFNSQSTNSLIISFNPELDQCLWVLSPEDTNLRLISPDMRKLSSVSAIERISYNNGEERALPEAIFGKLQNKGWCYYFEKADLARQTKRWDQVVKLYEKAKTDGVRPGNGFEYIPFIEGYAHLGNWKMVISLTRSANKISKGLEPSLCDALGRVLVNTQPTAERDTAIRDLQDYLDCADF